MPAPGGSPAPVPPLPITTIDLPTGAPTTAPTITCDGSDICSSINKLGTTLMAMSAQIAALRRDVTFIQRNKVPVTYLAETEHLELRGSGSFGVFVALGFQLTITGTPPIVKTIPGDPAYIWDVGWMAISSPSGMLAEKRITRQSMTWLPDGCSVATQFSYYVNPGYEISVVTLLAEP